MSSNTKQVRKPELLAPAGGFEQLRYALYFGADAVYLACDKFGLRQRAQNFSLADMPRAVQTVSYTHLTLPMPTNREV